MVPLPARCEKPNVFNYHAFVSGILFLAVLLHGVFSSCDKQGLPVAVCRLRIAVASLVALEYAGSVVVAYGFSCSMASEIFLDQGLKTCPLHWMEDSYPLCHQGSPVPGIFGGRTLTL